MLLHIELNPEEHQINDQKQNFIIEYSKNWGNRRYNITDETWRNINIRLSAITKIVYSTTEVNFTNKDIKSITAKNIDDDMPKEISKDLNIEIPQLLVDIKSLDDSDIASWVSEQANQSKSVSDKPVNVWNRLQRFCNAFHKIYNGTKIFETIRNRNGKKLIIFKDNQDREIDIAKFSSWEQQVLYRVWYILKNLSTINWWIILIDEPEISLHPIRQERLRELLLEIFEQSNVQIILTTHSPYIFRKINDNSWNEVCIKIDSHSQISWKVQITFPWLNYTPSPNYISYIAYGIYNQELHIELYEQLLIKYNKEWPWDLDNYLKNPANNINEPIKQRFNRIDRGRTIIENETIMTRIRNKIHHPTDPNRPSFNDTDLKESIDRIIQILAL